MILTAYERGIVTAHQNGDLLDPHDAADASELASLAACERLLAPIGSF